MFYTDRTEIEIAVKRQGGGLLTYVNKKLNIQKMEDWSTCTPHVEMQWLKLQLKDTRDTYLANIYRAPDGNVDEFIQALEIVLLDIMALGNPDIVVIGDTNINMMKNSDPNTKKLKSFLQANRLEQLIKESTRVTERSQTLIDHVMVNRNEMYHQNGVIELGVSDHSLIYTSRKKLKVEYDTEYVWTRSYRSYNDEMYERDIANADWSPVLNASNVNVAVNQFYRIILEIIEKHAPDRKSVV